MADRRTCRHCGHEFEKVLYFNHFPCNNKSGDRSPSNPPANVSFPSLQNVAANIEDLDHASNTSHLGGGDRSQSNGPSLQNVASNIEDIDLASNTSHLGGAFPPQNAPESDIKEENYLPRTVPIQHGMDDYTLESANIIKKSFNDVGEITAAMLQLEEQTKQRTVELANMEASWKYLSKQKQKLEIDISIDEFKANLQRTISDGKFDQERLEYQTEIFTLQQQLQESRAECNRLKEQNLKLQEELARLSFFEDKFEKIQEESSEKGEMIDKLKETIRTLRMVVMQLDSRNRQIDAEEALTEGHQTDYLDLPGSSTTSLPYEHGAVGGTSELLEIEATVPSPELNEALR